MKIGNVLKERKSILLQTKERVDNMDNDEIIGKFRQRIKYVKLSFVTSIIGIIFIMYGTIHSFISGNIIIQSIGMVFFIGGIVVKSIAWRCPVCKKPLPTRQLMKYINYCSNCNAKLK